MGSVKVTLVNDAVVIFCTRNQAMDLVFMPASPIFFFFFLLVKQQSVGSHSSVPYSDLLITESKDTLATGSLHLCESRW